MRYDIDQPKLIAGIGNLLSKKHGVKGASPRQFNAIIRAANTLVEDFGRDDVPATPGMGLKAWLASDDTGASSLYMAWVLCDSPHRNYAYPLDPDDFGRCVRFLEAVSAECGVRDIAVMRTCGPEWQRLVDAWKELTALYREELPSGSAPKLHSIMQELLSCRT